MSDDTSATTIPEADYKEIFNFSFFAALNGSAAAVGQDPGSIVNRAYLIAERAVERFRTGDDVLTEAQREIATKKRAEAALAAQLSGVAPGQPGVIMGGGHFQRPVAP